MNQVPPLRAVRVFESVGRCGAIGAASEELGVTPGACTQQIRLLEQHLGVRLVQRSGRGIELTRWGSMYLQYASRALEELRTGAKEVKIAQRSNQMTISAFPSVVNCWLATLLFEWQRRYSDSRIRIEAWDPEPQLEEGEADFRISYGPLCRCHQRYKRLFTDYVFPVASPRLISQISAPINPQDLLSAPLLCVDWGAEYIYGADYLGPPSWKEWLAACGVKSTRVPYALTFSLSSAALDAAIEGRGIVLAQHSMVRRALHAGLVHRLCGQALPLPEPYYVAWSRASLDKSRGRTFLSWLTEATRVFDWSVVKEHSLEKENM